MVELLEYSLVVLVSTMFIAASILSFGAFSGFEGGVNLKAEYSALSTLALEAAGGGSSRAVLFLPQSTVTCEGGVLTVTSGSTSQGGGVGAACDFSVGVRAGVHAVAFSDGPGGLDFTVD